MDVSIEGPLCGSVRFETDGVSGLMVPTCPIPTESHIIVVFIQGRDMEQRGITAFLS